MKRLFVVVAVVAALAGCAVIPDSGPVTKAGAVSGTNASTVRYAPAGPAKDASAQDIVRGYLDAMLAYPITSGTAAMFLSKDAADSWKPSAGVTIYDEPEVATRSRTGRGAGTDDAAEFVRLAVHEVGSLNRQGDYVVADARHEFDFRLVKVRGQWRISNPQPGFLVSRKFFMDYYRPFNTYFFDPTGKRLVPEPVYVPVGDQVSTGLLSSLLMGPAPAMRTIARSYIPTGAQLRTSVPLRADGLAEVQFKNDFAGMPTRERERVAAQIAWTLRQVLQVNQIRITADDTPVLAGTIGTQSVDSWQEFGPRFGSGTFFGVQGKRLVRVVGRAVGDVGGPWQSRAEGVAELAVDDGNIAVVNSDRTSLAVGNLAKKAATTVTGNRILRPLWDDAGRLWVIDTADGDTRIRLVTGKAVRQLRVAAIGKLTIASFALSPDMARYALIARSGGSTGVYVGDVVRDANDEPTSLSAPTALPMAASRLTRLRSIAWATSTTVTFLADESAVGTQVFEARIDGSVVVGGTARSGALLPSVDATILAASGGDDPMRYVIDATGDVWMLSAGEAWERLDAGKFTALASSTD